MPVQDEVEVRAVAGKSPIGPGTDLDPVRQQALPGDGEVRRVRLERDAAAGHTERGEHLTAAGVDVEDPFGPAGGFRGQRDVVPGQRVAHHPPGQAGEVPAGQRLGGGLGQQPVDLGTSVSVIGHRVTPDERPSPPRRSDQPDSTRPPQKCNAFSTAEATVGTMPSSRNAGMKQTISGSTLRTPTRRAASST